MICKQKIRKNRTVIRQFQTFKRPIETALCIATSSASIASIKRKGENGSPYTTPLSIQNSFVRAPFTRCSQSTCNSSSQRCSRKRFNVALKVCKRALTTFKSSCRTIASCNAGRILISPDWEPLEPHSTQTYNE